MWFTVLEVGKSKIKTPSDLVSGEGSLLLTWSHVLCPLRADKKG